MKVFWIIFLLCIVIVVVVFVVGGIVVYVEGFGLGYYGGLGMMVLDGLFGGYMGYVLDLVNVIDV